MLICQRVRCAVLIKHGDSVALSPLSVRKLWFAPFEPSAATLIRVAFDGSNLSSHKKKCRDGTKPFLHFWSECRDSLHFTFQTESKIMVSLHQAVASDCPLDSRI